MADGWARTLRGLHDAYSELETVVARQADADLERPLKSRHTRAVSTVSRSVMHDAYHIGEIVLLRKLQGSGLDRFDRASASRTRGVCPAAPRRWSGRLDPRTQRLRPQAPVCDTDPCDRPRVTVQVDFAA